MADPVRQPITPLDWKTPIVDTTTGAPTSQFIRLWQQLFGNDSANNILKADKATVIATTTGLQGGGDLSANRTLSIAATTVVPASYTNANITVNQQGQITTAASGSSSSGVIVQEEGVTVLSGATTLNFIGAGVTATTPASGVADITVSGGGGQQLRIFGNTGFGLTQLNLAISSVGSKTNNVPTGTIIATSRPHMTMITGSVLNSISSYHTQAGVCRRGSVLNSGGFSMKTGGNPTSVSGACTWFIGLCVGQIASPFAGEASTFTNIFGIGCDSGDTNLQLMHNDGAGTATRIDLGASFPARTATAVYELEISCPSGASASITYTVTRLDVAASATGVISAELPAQDEDLAPGFYVNNLSTGLSRTVRVYGAVLSTP